MILLVGCGLGLGLLLVVSPFLWRTQRRGLKRAGGFTQSLTELMRQAGLRSVSLPVFVVVSLVVGIAAGALVFVVVPVVALAAAAGAVALTLPTVIVSGKARAQRKTRRALWPDVIDHLVSATRSGLALPDSVAALSLTGPEATRSAFARFQSDYEASGNFARSLDRLKERVSDPVADRIFETLRMSREIGGTELPSVLRALAAHLRVELAIRGEVEARQSWVMNAARLGAVAPWLILALLSTRPEAAASYNSSAGIVLIVGGLLATLVAYRMMVALARLPEERRWFR